MTQFPWIFEPCENEGPIRDTKGVPWAHAVRGRKAARPSVIGYGHNPDDAERDAVHKAHQQDAREVLGQRGEVVTSMECTEETDIRLEMTILDPIDARPSILRELCSIYGWHIEIEDWPFVTVRLSV